MAFIGLGEIPIAIVGGGPSSLILSYILHGHVPYYSGGHQDALLDSKLRKLPNLLHVTPEIWSHFGSSLRYSASALPVNILLDTLIRPNADTLSLNSFVEWRYHPEVAVPHVVFVKEEHCGGVWVSCPEDEVEDAGTLSYAELLSLPGYSFADHYMYIYGKSIAELQRPSKVEVASYFATYPRAVGISQHFRMNSPVTKVSRIHGGFHLQPFNITCRQLVLATGVFDHNIQPPAALRSLSKLDSKDLPILVVGSGYSAADAIVSTPCNRPIIHIYRWNPAKKASPLQGCHHQAYPEYAGIYRKMKDAAQPTKLLIAPRRKKRTRSFMIHRDWQKGYEGLPNAKIESIRIETEGAKVKICLENGKVEERRVGGLDYFVGRRGSLAYLDTGLRNEILPPQSADEEDKLAQSISSTTLRAKAEADTEVAPSVFIIGSLTGDSLIRHAFGACIQTASHIMQRNHQPNSPVREILHQGCMKRMGCTRAGASDDGIAINS